MTRDAVAVAARGAERLVTLGDGTEVRTRTVVVATGVAYNRLAVAGLDALLGMGVFYGSTTAETPAQAGREVFVVGGGNSAGQAAVHLARYAARVTVLVRGGGLTMSDYLVKQLGRCDNVRVRLDTELVGVHGCAQLEAIDVRDCVTGATERLAGSALFVLIGAGPHTRWLAGLVQRDETGHLLTGSSVVRGDAAEPAWCETRAPHPLETSLPGVVRQRRRSPPLAARGGGRGRRRRHRGALGPRVPAGVLSPRREVRRRTLGARSEPSRGSQF